jgi:GDP-4-dehydro-6-deoxy-D-mannose reductase
VRILVTGADGFAGRRLVPRLVGQGHDVVAAVGGAPPPPAFPDGVAVTGLDLRQDGSVAACVAPGFDAVVHLAAVASGTEARRDPGMAWEVNAAGTARLCEAIADQRAAGGREPRVLVVSTAEVYGAARGRGRRLRRETDVTRPCSPYAASKLGAEVAALEAQRRTGLAVVVARPFPHTGAGQDERFVVPAFARRLAAARRVGAGTIAVGNLEPVRDFLHVDDVLDAYLALIERGAAGAVYNIASGRGVSIADVLARLQAMLGSRIAPVADPSLMRQADVPYLVGDATRLRERTGWTPRRSLDDALAEVVRAQAD